jgi:tetratricopeptide (TPR) repeat protein
VNHVHNINSSASSASDSAELLRLLPVEGKADADACDEAAPALPRIFQLDARFAAGGVWSGVDRLIETAYLSLLEMGQSAIVDEHLLEFYMVLPTYRSRIQPKYWSLTDTAGPGERTRFYALERGHRLVHGLVGLILQWKRAQADRARKWVVIVRGFDQAQHLAARFFTELARRSAAGDGIIVIVETQRDASNAVEGVRAVPAAPWIMQIPLEPVAKHEASEAEIKTLETQIANGGGEALLEQKYPALLAHYLSSGNGLAAARTALKTFVIFNGYGYYKEATYLMEIILPYFDQLVEGDENKRDNYVSRMNLCLVMTDDPAGALRVVENYAAEYITKPHLVANMHYILGMHYLRYAEAKDLARAEHHIVQAVENIDVAKDDPEFVEYPFRKVFIDNGLAFLRARQGRHQEALALCEAGYRFLTNEMGEDRHTLHRSVLQYNIAQVYVMLGHLDQGLAYYHNAIAMDPNYSEYYNETGNILQEQGHLQEAIAYYIEAVKRSAPYPEVYFNKAVCHARLGQLDDALGCFRTTLELNPAQPQAYALQADMLRELGEDDAALAGYDTAIARGFDSAAVRVNRAVLHFNAGSYELALADMDHVIDLDPDEASHYENRAAIYEAMHRGDLHSRDIAMAERCKEAA